MDAKDYFAAFSSRAEDFILLPQNGEVSSILDKSQPISLKRLNFLNFDVTTRNPLQRIQNARRTRDLVRTNNPLEETRRFSTADNTFRHLT